MSKALWSGNMPSSEGEAKARLCEAGMTCFKRLGFEKTTMSDIAKTAGVARPTLYKHFKSKHELFFNGIDSHALIFSEAAAKHARRFEILEERAIELVVYVVKNLPNHKYLSLVFDNECAIALQSRAFSDIETKIFLEITAQPLIEVCPELTNEASEITEFLSRIALSLIQFPGLYGNNPKNMRRMLEKRVLPGIRPNLP